MGHVKNVIVIMADTFRWDCLSCYSNKPVATPNLDRFAQQSAIFDKSFFSSHPTHPQRTDCWLGKPCFLFRGWQGIAAEDREFSLLLRSTPITTMLIGDSYHVLSDFGAGMAFRYEFDGNYQRHFKGWEMIRGQEADHWITSHRYKVKLPCSEHKLRSTSLQYLRNAAVRKGEEDWQSPKVFRAAMDWLDMNYDDPNGFVLWIDSFDPHEPWDPPEKYWLPYNPNRVGEFIYWPKYAKTDLFTDDDMTMIRALYHGEVTLFDAWFGKFIARCESLGLMENTLIIFFSDHGIHLGDHGVVGKPGGVLCPFCYNELARIPFLVRHPNMKCAGKHLPHLVQSIDMYATILDAVGHSELISPHVASKSIMPILDDPSRGLRDYAVYARPLGPMHITDGTWQLFIPVVAKGDIWNEVRHEMESDNARPALYYLPTDPEQVHNRHGEEPKVQAELQDAMMAFLDEQCQLFRKEEEEAKRGPRPPQKLPPGTVLIKQRMDWLKEALESS